MTDTIDRANAQSEQILAMQIKNATAHTVPSPITDCVDCGQMIGAERKKTLPHAVRCIGCQWQWERTHEKSKRWMTLI
ncbi:MAG: TraR/DksA C4-type zinc finger protein [Moraxella sp.]|nr:TraR/DksA C4-type zinc finger protein [Moraxella sp.]